jgi:undecaprenyl-diphosphatase
VKSAFRRLRPQRPSDAPLRYGLRQPITSSFPSGHATAAFCAATLLAKGSGAAPAWFALASLVAATRVYVRLHHASDVVAGAAFGVVLGTALRPMLAADLSGRTRS